MVKSQKPSRRRPATALASRAKQRTGAARMMVNTIYKAPSSKCHLNKHFTIPTALEVVEAINACKCLEFLNLEGNTLGVGAANGIAKALERHPEFKRALWKDLFTGRLKTEIPQALESMGRGMIAAGAHLALLDCSDNALGPNGMRGLIDLLKSPACYSLTVSCVIRCDVVYWGGACLKQQLE